MQSIDLCLFGEGESAEGAGDSSPIRAHYDGLIRQAEEFSAEQSDFDLRRELEDGEFVRLTSPHYAMSVKQAYRALHHEELLRRAAEQAAEETARRLAQSISSYHRRPQENGIASTAPAVAVTDWRRATPAQRQAHIRAIKAAAARGEHIYPSDAL